MMDLQPEMQDILRRNGMQAHVVSDGTVNLIDKYNCRDLQLF